MRETGIGTSLLLIAMGAVLAFAINYNATGIDINAVGAILMVVGIIGLLFSFLALGEMFPSSRLSHGPELHDDEVYEPAVTPPHEHRRVETRDVVYEDERGTTVERVRRGRPG